LGRLGDHLLAGRDLVGPVFAALTNPVCLFFDERFQPRQRILPLLGDMLEILSDLVNGFGFKLEAALASDANAANDTCILQDAKVLSHRLSGQPGTDREA
jgi:hypothetical protein